MVVHVVRRFVVIGAAAALALLTPNLRAQSADQDSPGSYPPVDHGRARLERRHPRASVGG